MCNEITILYLLGKTIPLNNNNNNNNNKNNNNNDDDDDNNNGLFTAYPHKKNVAPHLQRPNIEKWRKGRTLAVNPATHMMECCI